MSKLKIANYPIGPFPAALAGAVVDGRPNFAAVGACGVICLEPVLYVSLKDSHHTTAGVAASGWFSLNIPSAEQVRKVDYCGITTGSAIDKSSVFKLFFDPAGPAPLIEDCPLNFLCQVINTIPVFDFKMFLGKIAAVYINEDCLTDGKPDPLKINPLVLMGASYLSVGGVVGTIYQEGRKPL